MTNKLVAACDGDQVPARTVHGTIYDPGNYMGPETEVQLGVNVER